MSGTCPAHKGRLVAAVSFEINGPVLAHQFHAWVVVHMLVLRHVDAGNLVSEFFVVRNTHPFVSSG